MTTTTIFPTELTPDVLDRLGAPVPANEIKSMPNNPNIRYTDEGFVRGRLDEVVGEAGWEDNYVVTYLPEPVVINPGKKNETLVIGSVTCSLTVLGKRKSAVADQEVEPSGMYGGPGMNAQARALKRAAMKFRVARELWEKDHPEYDENTNRSAQTRTSSASRGTYRPAAGTREPGSGNGKATPKMVKWLTDTNIAKGGFAVPQPVAEQLSFGSASKLIDQLKIAQKEDGYEQDPLAYIEEALQRIGERDLIEALYAEEAA